MMAEAWLLQSRSFDGGGSWN